MLKKKEKKSVFFPPKLQKQSSSNSIWYFHELRTLCCVGVCVCLKGSFSIACCLTSDEIFKHKVPSDVVFCLIVSFGSLHNAQHPYAPQLCHPLLDWNAPTEQKHLLCEFPSVCRISSANLILIHVILGDGTGPACSHSECTSALKCLLSPRTQTVRASG